MSTFIAEMLSTGALDVHIQGKLIPCYAKRYYTMISAIKEHLEPLGVKITTGKAYSKNLSGNETITKTHVGIAGGFFLMITLPTNLPPTPDLAKIALEKHELKFAYGKMFAVKGDLESQRRSSHEYGNVVRLCWAFHEEDIIVEGIKRLKELLVENIAEISKN